MQLTRLVQEWFWEELDRQPARDPRRTAQCLGFDQIEAAARQPEAAPAAQLAHLVACDWCRHNWITFQTLGQAAPAAFVPVAQSPVELSSAGWTPEYSALVSRYLTSASSLAQENREPTPAHFDAEGTLRVHWSGLEYEGAVSVSLLINGAPQFLTSGIVQNGALVVVEPLAQLGQRNVELPVSVLQLQLLQDPAP